MARPRKDAVKAETVDYVPEVDAQDEPKVEIVAEFAPKDEKNIVKSAEEGIAELNRSLKEANERILKVERERNEAVQRAYTANNEKEDTDLRLFESAKHQLEANSAMLEHSYADALVQGDTVRAAKIMREMASNEAKALQLENGKQSLKEKNRVPPVVEDLDPVEAFAKTRTPRTAAWVRDHPEYITNKRLTDQMVAAHNFALAKGHQEGGDSYFETVENLLGVNKRAAPQQDDDWQGEQYSEASRGQGGRHVAPAALPVSRDVSPSGRNTRVIRASVAQQEAAAASQMSIEDYMAQVHRIERDRREGMN